MAFSWAWGARKNKLRLSSRLPWADRKAPGFPQRHAVSWPATRGQRHRRLTTQKPPRPVTHSQARSGSRGLFLPLTLRVAVAASLPWAFLHTLFNSDIHIPRSTSRQSFIEANPPSAARNDARKTHGMFFFVWHHHGRFAIRLLVRRRLCSALHHRVLAYHLSSLSCALFFYIYNHYQSSLLLPIIWRQHSHTLDSLLPELHRSTRGENLRLSFPCRQCETWVE